MTGGAAPKIIYCGLDLKAWEILSVSPRFDIAAVNKIGDFLDQPGFNPFDALFRAVYRLRCAGNRPCAEGFLAGVYRCCFFLSSRLYRTYARYLDRLCRRKIPVLDFDRPEDVEAFCRARDIPLMVVNNWWLLPDRILNAPSGGTVNIHPSRLPQYRGSLPTLWSLKNRDPETAVSLILLQQKMDAGNILAQYPVAIDPAETSVSLEGKIEAVLAAQLEAALADYLAGATAPLIQDESQASATARYFPYMKITWAAETARDIADKINLYPYLWPAHWCWTREAGNKLAFRKCILNSGPFSGNQRPVLATAGDYAVKGLYLYVRASDNILRMNLFTDIAPLPSLKLLLRRRGKFDETGDKTGEK